MQLSQEERQQIYEEEKARIEAEQKQSTAESGSTLNLPQNVAALLCYLGLWVTGIIFLVLEKKNKVVLFHAIQSIVVFGGLTILSACLSWIPSVGNILSVITGCFIFISWVVLMVKAYQGENYKIPVAGDVTEAIYKYFYQTGESSANNTGDKGKETGKSEEVVSGTSQKAEDSRGRKDNYYDHTRVSRIAGYCAAIFWNIALIVFSTLYYEYIAWYSMGDNGSFTRVPILTDDYLTWLPIFVASLVICIVANMALIIFDRYWFRETVQIVLELIGIGVVVTLLNIAPFDLSVIPDAKAANIASTALTVILIFAAVAFGISALTRFLKLIFKVEKY